MQANLKQYDNIVIAGFGMTGVACARFLLAKGVVPVVLDSRAEPPGAKEAPELLSQVEAYFGDFALEHLLAADLIVVSPGLDTRFGNLRMAADAGIRLISDIEMMAWFVKVPVIAVTGSNGKSTVTELCYHILKKSGMRAAMGGNIGIPALDLLLAKPAYEAIVLELSSFQLELTESLRLEAACILNITADHLDRYDDERGYQRAKQRIYRHAKSRVWNCDDALTKPRGSSAKSRNTKFGSSALPDGFGLQQEKNEFWLSWRGLRLIRTRDLPLAGVHNWLNIMAACGLCRPLGIEPADAVKLIKDFKALPHRCEVVFDRFGVRWIDDSKATNAGATIAAINGMRPDVKGKLILIAGGDAKGADLSVLAPVLEQVDVLITLGRDGHKIAVLKEGAITVKTMDEAVEAAKGQLNKGAVVLLSPACASLDMFKDYKHRGMAFKKAVEVAYGS
ncbi:MULTISPECIES: UDP-N-acetylmuramoyl-L-alanine--D-glutamate ligase [Gammaproteobacteria]|uniref:UDP-N-acetylmuramoyl-L-alanine--D-glutamate ligase n=1 Tax=Gammaproteobacteria TaxID=1236 RepID=UPI000DD08F27|nr:MULTISPECIES: UDP-N-acetylmuramoyl-L-alanine--D-glutamate ligase [Gammaproteobacteria]RTE86319.1 UDP-N-acetylmuramoyl-L-alanine--D-glutamate ligase [Aliidiomarina sp. B3213]TCZ91669.1 UDP-N-acetylmuramoyl-L-alanine--D-glutamate ligase [Lysobacter sp. N42]